ncbi:MAG: shikimate dehydrogenase [Pseudomonadota bacterium]
MDDTGEDGPSAFVTGWPINHSRSPLIHGHWLKDYGLSGSYEKVATEPSAFVDFITHLNQSPFMGGNVTLPHKETTFQCADILTPTAKRLKAANTVWLQDGKLHADNTDGYGFLANLDQSAVGWDTPDRLDRPCLVLGAGGASRAVVDALSNRGFSKIVLANRTVARAETLLDEIAPLGTAISLADTHEMLGEAGVIVNTTSIGMDDTALPIGVDGIYPKALVTDIVYTPLITPFLRAAAAQHIETVDGLGMLLHQAVPGFERWFGLRPNVDAKLRQLIVDDLEGARR